jgi:oligopeptidase B
LDASDFHQPLRRIRERQNGIQYYVEHSGVYLRLLRFGSKNRSFTRGFLQDYFYIVNNVDGSQALCISRILALAKRLDTGWETVVPSRPGVSIEDADFFRGRLVLYGRDKGRCFVEEYSIDDDVPLQPHRLSLACAEEAGDWAPRANVVSLTEFVWLSRLIYDLLQLFDTDSLRVSFSSPTTPPVEYDYLFKERRLAELSRERFAERLMSEFMCTALESTSDDGTRIPMTLVHRKNFPRDHS